MKFSKQSPTLLAAVETNSWIAQKFFFSYLILEMALLNSLKGFPGGSAVKNLPANAGDWGLIPRGQEDPLEKEMATHPSILA